MKRIRFFQIIALVFGIVSSAIFTNAQGTQILYNKSFENTGLGDHPDFCLPLHSGETPRFIIGDCLIGAEIFNWFAMLTNWVSYYQRDQRDCNVDVNNYESHQYDDWYVHSPDWVGGAVPCPGWSPCLKGWDQNYSVGMGSYEVIWQDFVGSDPSKPLDIDKSYEVRIKVKPRGYTTVNGNGNYMGKYLDVLLGTQAFTYKRDEMGFFHPFGDEDNCGQCDNKYREYLITPSEEVKILKRFPIGDFENYGVAPYTTMIYENEYDNWFELHAKIKMSDLLFTGISISQFVQFGMDIRDPDWTVISEDGTMCDGPYLQIDQVEFFESCPDHYEIYGAKIAGSQSAYVATNYIKAGFIDKGPAIVTSNGKTDFIAGHFVDLVPGFFADYNSVVNIQAVPNVDCSLYKSTIIDPEIEANKLEDLHRNYNYGSLGDEQILKLDIFPNPSSGVLNVRLDKGMINSISIMDNLGKMINFIDNVDKSEFQLDISRFNSGVYSITVQSGEGELFYQRIVKI